MYQRGVSPWHLVMCACSICCQHQRTLSRLQHQHYVGAHPLTKACMHCVHWSPPVAAAHAHSCACSPPCLLLPADNLVSKLNAQKGATAGDIIKQMGWYNLFTRGLGLRIIMIGTLTGLQVSLDGEKRGMGVWRAACALWDQLE
jgi:hypothetical protein